MSVPYEKIVAEDLNTGLGTVSVSMPGGGSATGNKVNLGTFGSLGFSATRSSTQSISTATLTTCQVDTEDFDPATWYDNSTYTFTPTKAGLYLAFGQLNLASFTGTVTLEIYRGATSVGKVDEIRSAASAYIQVLTLVSMNGSTDALTMKITHTSAGSVNASGMVFAAVLLGSL